MWKAQDFLNNGVIFIEQIKKGLQQFFNIKTTNVFVVGTPHTRKDGFATRGIRLRIKKDRFPFKV